MATGPVVAFKLADFVAQPAGASLCRAEVQLAVAVAPGLAAGASRQAVGCVGVAARMMRRTKRWRRPPRFVVPHRKRRVTSHGP